MRLSVTQNKFKIAVTHTSRKTLGPRGRPLAGHGPGHNEVNTYPLMDLILDIFLHEIHSQSWPFLSRSIPRSLRSRGHTASRIHWKALLHSSMFLPSSAAPGRSSSSMAPRVRSETQPTRPPSPLNAATGRCSGSRVPPEVRKEGAMDFAFVIQNSRATG